MGLKLNGNYVGRSGGFLYSSFVEDALNSLNGESVNKTLLYREAIQFGAVGKSSETVLKKLSQSLNSIANKKGFKRHKIKGETGYFFKKV